MNEFFYDNCGGVKLDSKERALLKALKSLLEDKEAIDMVILDMSKTNMLTDYFFILTGNSSVHINAMRDSLVEFIEDSELKLIYTDKGEAGDWVLVDSGDIVFHIFSKRGREFYALEDLWKESKRVDC